MQDLEITIYLVYENISQYLTKAKITACFSSFLNSAQYKLLGTINKI